MRLLFVHGIAQGGRNPETVKSEWLSSLEKGLNRAGVAKPADLTIDLPFFGDDLDRFVAEMNVPTPEQIVAKGANPDEAYASFREDMTEQMRRGANISAAEVQTEMGTNVVDKGPQNWRWVQAIIRVLDRRVPAVSGWSIERFLQEVFVYIKYEHVRAAIDKIVSDMLLNDTAVIVGHSLGSVISYNILRARSGKAPLFVTVGSPLAIAPIRTSLQKLINPATRGWYNALDPADVVALYPLDAKNFNVLPAITNYAKVKNWTENRHGIIGYLDDAEVAKAIHAGLRP
jgi:hypothetical protein